MKFTTGDFSSTLFFRWPQAQARCILLFPIDGSVGSMRYHLVSLVVCCAYVLVVPSAGWSLPVKLVLDTDIGTDFDDTFALLYLLSRPDIFDLRLVQASTFNTTKRALVVAGILASLGRFDIPVGIGRYTGEQRMPQYSVVANYSLAQFVADGGHVLQPNASIQHMADLLANATPEEPLFVVEIAPTTSLAEAIRLAPAAATANCVLTAMSGSIRVGYANASFPSAEYNVATDVASSQTVYRSQWREGLMTAPLDTTIFMQFGEPQYQTLLSVNDSMHPFVATLLRNYEAWYAGGGDTYYALKPFSPTTGTSTMYDLQAAYMAGHRALGGQTIIPYMNVTVLPLVVTPLGFTVLNETSGKNVSVALSFQSGRQDPYVSVGAIAADTIASLISPR